MGLAGRLRSAPTHRPAAQVPPAPAVDISEGRVSESPPASIATASAIGYRRSYALAAAVILVVALGSAMAASKGGARSGSLEPAASISLPRPPATLSTGDPVRKTARAEAEDLYQQGRYLVENGRERNDFAQAVMFFERALIADPTFVLAYSGLADAYSANGQPDRARGAALKALSLDPNLAEAHASLSYVLGFYDHRWLAADSALARAVALSPQNALTHLRRAYIYAVLDRADEALASLERARAIEPQSWIVLYNRALVTSALRRPNEAIRHFEAALALKPDRRDVRYALANEYWLVGRRSDAAAAYRSIGMLNSALIAEEDTMEMRRLVRRHETDSITMAPTTAARIYARLGRRDEAFRELKLAVRKNRFLPLEIRQAPLVWLKPDLRYARVMAELGLGEPARYRQTVVTTPPE